MNWTNCFSNKRFGVDVETRGPRTEYELSLIQNFIKSKKLKKMMTLESFIEII